MSLGVTRSDDDDDHHHRTNGSIDRSTPPRARVVTRRPGAGVDHGWGGVGSSRDRSMSPSACTSRDHAREIRGYTLQIPIHGVFSYRVRRTYGARRGRTRDVGRCGAKATDCMLHTARRRGDDGWIGREKNLFIEARARCRRKNDRACGSVSSAPRARRRRRRRRRPNRRRRAI